MRRLTAFWVTYWTIAGWFFWYADRHGYALCRVVRHLYGTTNPDPARARNGKLRLAVSLGAGVTILFRHLVKPGTSSPTT